MEISFTERELDVITVLWDHGPSTAAEVRAHMGEDLAYNTVLTMLRILEEKGYARHEAEGRAHRYFPLVTRKEAGESATGRLVRRMFRGSPSLLLTQLVSQRDLSERDLKRLRDLIDQQLGEGDR
jgi:BlaI family transcriptional regulator, penicillinase repressor